MKSHPLPQFEAWEDFDQIAHVLEKPLGWNPQQKVDGPDARSWSFGKNGRQVWLVFDDVMGMALKCEDDASHLPKLGEAILVALNYDGRHMN